MSLSSTCIKRPVLATVLNLILVIVGSIGLLYLGVRDYPSVDPPVISVSTSFVQTADSCGSAYRNGNCVGE